jgi:predicted kinase
LNLQSTINLYGGGPGSGCQGPNCGRPAGPSSDPRDRFIGIAPPPTKPLAQGQTTEEAWKNKAGEWDPAREAWHQAVAERMIAGVTKVEGRAPEATVLGGGQASGKSTMSKKIIGENKNIVRLDADETKLLIPEYEGLKDEDPASAAARVHEESSYITKLALAKAAAKGLDLVYDATSSGKGGPVMVKTLADEGYRVHLLFVDVPMEVARQRAAERAADPSNLTGYMRHPPPGRLEESHISSASNFLRMKDMPEAQSALLYNTEGTTPKVVFGRTGFSNGIIFDQGRWQDYQKKAAGGQNEKAA